MSEQYVIERDSYNRLRADICPSTAVGIRMLAEDHPRRIENHVHAYVVVDLRTELGPWRIRDIRIMRFPGSENYFVRYRQWKTGRNRPDGEGKPEWLDVAGPLDRDTRAKIQESILAVFLQIREEAAAGTLGRNQSPEVQAQLVSLKEDLKTVEAPEGEGLGDVDGNVAEAGAEA